MGIDDALIHCRSLLFISALWTSRLSREPQTRSQKRWMSGRCRRARGRRRDLTGFRMDVMCGKSGFVPIASRDQWQRHLLSVQVSFDCVRLATSAGDIWSSDLARTDAAEDIPLCGESSSGPRCPLGRPTTPTRRTSSLGAATMAGLILLFLLQIVGRIHTLPPDSSVTRSLSR
jgi:hypothetical protein